MSAIDRASAIAPEEQSARRKQLALLILCGAVFLDALDISLLGVSLPSIKNGLHLSDGSLQWLVSGYTVGYGGFLLLGGRVADMAGRRRTFMAATVLFIVASLLGGVLTSGALLIATRVLKGIAAGFTAPAAMSLITTTFKEGPERNRALGFFAMTGAGGYSFGLVLSGVLTEINWRLVFFAPGLIAILVLLATPVIRADERRTGPRQSFDGAGALSVTLGIMLLVYALVQAPGWGWGSGATIGCLLGAVALLGLFVLIESKHKSPLVPLSLFRARTLSTANLVSLVWAGSTIGWQFVATLYLQEAMHYSALRTAFCFLPLGVIIVAVAKFASGPMVNRFGMRAVLTLGMTIQAVGVLLYLGVGMHSGYAAAMLPGIILHGIGNGLVYPSVNIAGVNGVADDRQGVAAGLITASYQVGAGVGVAVLAAVLTATQHGNSVSGYHWAFLVAGLFSVVGLVVGFLGLRRGSGASHPVAGATTDTTADQSLTQAASEA
ncbi:MFS transporter [Kitasatospora sp. RB6PN24]|uniref:MFS transporter n=1 Tax=Kitasatospora humi TaxID=2893891 RepID=UPI001E3903E8|nr:MFS transporter [Kitasatospora humi]MCC9312451.1 MFS transporter [Kitasatospora humi]